MADQWKTPPWVIEDDISELWLHRRRALIEEEDAYKESIAPKPPVKAEGN